MGWKKYNLNNETAHNMAILAMDQYGFLLNSIISDSKLFRIIMEYKKISKIKKIPIFLPSQHMFKHNPLENSWNITSDSIAIYFATYLQIKNVILLTDVDGIFTEDPKKFPKSKLIERISAFKVIEIKQKTCVDSFIGKLLVKNNTNCYIANGFYPDRISSILNNKKTICTQIY